MFYRHITSVGLPVLALLAGTAGAVPAMAQATQEVGAPAPIILAQQTVIIAPSAPPEPA